MRTVAQSGGVVERKYANSRESFRLACSFDRAIILSKGYIGMMKADSTPYRLVVFRDEPGRYADAINLSDPFTMATSFQVFDHFFPFRCQCCDREERDMVTAYHVCSGDFYALESMIDMKKSSIFHDAKKSIDYYIGGPNDNERVVEMGKTFLHDIQFDKIELNVKDLDGLVDYIPTTVILANPTRHRDDEVPLLMGPTITDGESRNIDSPNFPKMLSHDRNLYILSPSQRVLDDAKANPIVLEDIQLPRYLNEYWESDDNKRWHLVDGKKVKTKMLFSLSAKTLYAMVETVADNPDAIKERSWHLTGLHGTGKSTCLLICQSLWSQRPSRFRVVYIPHANLFRQKEHIHFGQWFKMLICYAFLRDPIQNVLHQMCPYANAELLKELESYLESRNLFLVIIIDHLEEFWGRKTRCWELDTEEYIGLRLRSYCKDGRFKHILLITASSWNCSAACKRNVRKLDIEILNGFNDFEARWMVERLVRDGSEAARTIIQNQASKLGVRPFENDFTVNARFVKTLKWCSPTSEITSETIAERVCDLEETVKEKFLEFVNEDCLWKDKKLGMLHDVIYSNRLEKSLFFDIDYIDKRFVKPAMFPKSWESLGERVSKEKVAVGVLPLPGTTDVYGYEQWLCDPDFRKALGESELQFYPLPCDEIARRALHQANLSIRFERSRQKLRQGVTGSGPILLKDAFDQDIRFSGMKTIMAHAISFQTSSLPKCSAELKELIVFASVECNGYLHADLTVEQRRMDVN